MFKKVVLFSPGCSSHGKTNKKLRIEQTSKWWLIVLFSKIVYKCKCYILQLIVLFVCIFFTRLEASLGESEQRVCELSQALAQSEEQLSQLQSLSQSQSAQIQQLQDACTQLRGVQEMNEVRLGSLLLL